MGKEKYKIVYIGAGSFRFTIPCAMNILEFANYYNPIELWLVDVNFKCLSLMSYCIKLMVRYHKKDIIVFATTDRKKALENADYVLISISIGIQNSEWYDIFIPLKFGIPQNTGDTVGPGGIFRAIRTIPIMIEIMKDIRELCPKAMIINYTNPQSTIMLSLYQFAPEIQSIGLCHEFFYIGTKKFTRFLKSCDIITNKRDKFKLSYGGLNHFSWITKISYNGIDIYPQMREQAEHAYISGKFGRPFNYYLLKKYGWFCYVEDRHVAEFLPQYYNYFNYKSKPFGIKLRNVQRLHFYRNLVYSLVKWAINPWNNWIIKVVLRSIKGGEKALLIAKYKESNIRNHYVCNVLNNNTIPSLPSNCVVEIPCYFKDEKIYKTNIGPLPKNLNEIVKVHAENQQFIVDAAISGKTETLFKALQKDCLCAFIEDEEKIESLMYNMLYYQQKWLPNFRESILNFKDLKRKKFYIESTELINHKTALKEKFSLNLKLKLKAWPYID